MRIKFCSFLSILIICAGYNLPLISSNKSNSGDINLNLGIDFLRNLPKNDYIIGPGDSLKIIVSRDYPELDTNTRVDGEGTIYLPKLNRIFIQGLTITELNDLLNIAYKEYVKYPFIEVEISKYRPIRVLVEGEVESPGLQILEGSFSVSDLRQNANNEGDVSMNKNSALSLSSQTFYFPTVFDALRVSGGITPYSDLKNVQIIRKNNLSNGGGKISTTINFEEVIISGDSSQNIRIYDSDVVKVNKTSNKNDLNLRKAVLSNLNPKFINVFVNGRVNNPGLTVLSKASVLNDAIDMAGGAKILRGKVIFLRFKNDGTIDRRKISLRKNTIRDTYNNPLLRSGDVIIVGENYITKSNEIIREITSPMVGIFSAYGLIKAISD